MRSICLSGVQVTVEGEGWMQEWMVLAIFTIMAYFERKGCVQRNLYVNCVSLRKRFEG